MAAWLEAVRQPRLDKGHVVDTCTLAQYQAYLGTFTRPDPASRSCIQEGQVGLVVLPLHQFKYSPDVGYDFALAVKVEEATRRRLLFIRISSWDPQDPNGRASGQGIDFSIPLAHDRASPRERLSWTIGFGGAWSDSREEALLVFGADWADWFSKLAEGVAFANPGGQSGCLLRFGERERSLIQAFCWPGTDQPAA